MSTKQLRIAAPAKVNLFLRVVGKRPDGYHELSSWMQKLTLSDMVILETRPSAVTVQCPDSNLLEDNTNLAYKAAELFFEKSGLPGGVSITLHKKIPIAAGLGGGSSDAASVLNGLNELYNAGFSEKQLMDIGVLLGADVPFFVAGCNAALATGIGEKLEEQDSLTDCFFVLVNPGFPVSTKWVFENLETPEIANLALTIEGNPFILCPASDSDFSGKLYNDLEGVTISRYPEIAGLKQKLLDSGACAVLMSGSGPTVFGVFLKSDQGRKCADEFEKEYPAKVFYAESRV